MDFDHLRESAMRYFADAAECRESKPETSLGLTSDGHYILAGYYLANDDHRYEQEIRLLLSTELERYRRYGTTVRSCPQASYLWLSLAIDDIVTARSIASLPVERKDMARLDAYVVHKICTMLGVSQSEKVPDFRPTETERNLVSAIEAVASGSPYNESDVERFWSKLKKKRFQLTIFEYANLFTPALNTLSKV